MRRNENGAKDFPAGRLSGKLTSKEIYESL
jgi:hypothetical protein